MMNNTTECSTILLVCLGLDSDKTAAKKADVADLHALFRPFGSLSKVIIFSKKVLLKAFLEFRSAECASLARAELHDCFINDYGRVRLYFSALQELTFSNKYLAYKEYADGGEGAFLATVSRASPEQKQKTGATLKTCASVCDSKSVSPLEAKASALARASEPVMIRAFQDSALNKSTISDCSDSDELEAEAASDFSFSAHNTPQLSSKASDFGPTSTSTNQRPSLFKPDAQRQGLSEISRPSLFNSTQSTKHNIGVKARLQPLVLCKGSQFNSDRPALLSRANSNAEEERENLSVATGATTTTTAAANASPSKVILISNLDDCFFSVSELFNVFSCFGNIFKILLMKNLKKALVEYTSVEFAQNAFLHMNNRVLSGSKIKVNFSKYRKIDLKKNNKSENSQQFNQVMIVSQGMHRFGGAGAAAALLPPTDTLLLTCERTEGVKPIDLYLQVQSAAKPLTTKVLNEDKENDDSKSYRVLFKFANVQDALRALSKCHNSEVKGLPIKAVFSPLQAI